MLLDSLALKIICEMEVLDIETEETVFYEYYLFKSEEEFLQDIVISIKFETEQSSDDKSLN